MVHTLLSKIERPRSDCCIKVKLMLSVSSVFTFKKLYSTLSLSTQVYKWIYTGQPLGLVSTSDVIVSGVGSSWNRMRNRKLDGIGIERIRRRFSFSSDSASAFVASVASGNQSLMIPKNSGGRKRSMEVGEKRGYWLIPNAPLISTKIAFLCIFPCSNQQKQNHSPKIPFYVCDQAQLFPVDFNTPPHTFFCMRSRRLWKNPQNFQFVLNRGRWGFPPVSPFLPY